MSALFFDQRVVNIGMTVLQCLGKCFMQFSRFRECCTDAAVIKYGSHERYMMYRLPHCIVMTDPQKPSFDDVPLKAQ